LVKEIEKTKGTLIITKYGKPAVLIRPLKEEEFKLINKKRR